MSRAQYRHLLEERVAAATAEDALAPSEREVARFFVEHWEEVAFMSAGAIASAVGVGAATVVRTAQALGYAGLPAMKQEARRSLLDRSVPTLRVARGLEELGSDPKALLDQLLAFQIGILTDARQTLEARDFARAVGLLAKADRIVVFGLGANGSLAEHFAYSLRHAGRHALVIGRGAAIAEDLMELRTGDVLVALGYERPVPELTVSLDHARRLRIPRVLVTDRLALALKGSYDVALTARRSEPETIPTAVITVAVLEALARGLASTSPDQRVEAARLLEDLRNRLDKM